MSTCVIIAGITDMSKIFQRLYLNPLWGTEALPTLLPLRSSLSTTLPLSRRHLPKPQPPGLGYNRSELVYKQHKHYNEIFKKKSSEKLIWEDYVRNHKGQIPPQKVRKKCKRKKLCSNPCPICKNEIDVDYKDIKLLKQFINPYTGQMISALKTGVCKQQQKKLEAAVEKAYDHGYLTYTIPNKLPIFQSDIPEDIPPQFKKHKPRPKLVFNKLIPDKNDIQ